MSFLNTGVKILIWLGIVFFGVFSYFCLLWTERPPLKISNIMGAIAVSLLYTFKIFFIGAIFLVLIYLVSYYLKLI
ncbi:MAG: hypothetical protein QMC93_02855 [Patescibacteria group bacterium]|nr:hypothetical protein [Patescibacteria group bacterium]